VTTFALDSSALIAWVLQENGRWRGIDRVLTSPGVDPVLPGPALTEVITVLHRRGKTSSSAQIVATLRAIGVRVEHAIDVDLIRAAELLEVSIAYPAPKRGDGSTPTLSLADSIILAITERLRLKILTRDRYWVEFANDGHTTADVLKL